MSKATEKNLSEAQLRAVAQRVVTELGVTGDSDPSNLIGFLLMVADTVVERGVCPEGCVNVLTAVRDRAAQWAAEGEAASVN